MSVYVQSMVFEAGPQDLAQHSVMIALADNADDRGVAWPGDEHLAAKARMSVRNLIYVREALELAGWIAVKRRARVMREGRMQSGNLYQMNMLRLEAATAEARRLRQEARAKKPRATVARGTAKQAANEATCKMPHATVAPEPATCNSEQSDMQNVPERHAMALDELVLNQGDAFYNRHRTTIEPSTPPLPPASGGSKREVCGDCEDGRCVMNCGPCLPSTDDERAELADVNAMRARMKPPKPPLAWGEYAQGRGSRASGVERPGGRRPRVQRMPRSPGYEPRAPV